MRSDRTELDGPSSTSIKGSLKLAPQGPSLTRPLMATVAPGGYRRCWACNQPEEVKRRPARKREIRSRPVLSWTWSSWMERFGFLGLQKAWLRRTVATIVAVRPLSRALIRTKFE